MTMESFLTKRRGSFAAWRRRIGGVGICVVVFLFLSGGFSNLRAETVSALEFDGMNDVVDVPSRPVLGKTFTEEVWILPSAKDDGYHGVLGNPSTGIANRSPSIWIHHQTAVHAGFGDGKDWNACTSKPNVLVPNAWNHVATIYDGNFFRILINGVEAAKLSVKKVPVHQPVVRIGRVDYCFPGAIREVRLWNRALSGDEIRRQMGKALSGNEDGLVAYFPFNDGSGSQAKNLARDGADAAVLNGPKWIESAAPVAPLALKSEARAAGPGAVEKFLPIGENVAPDTAIEIVLRKAAEMVEPGSIHLSLDKASVEPTITTNDAGGLLVYYETGALLESASLHQVELSYAINGKNTEQRNFSYHFSISQNVILSK